MPKGPFRNAGKVGNFLDVTPQDTPWFGKEALRELPTPAKWWEKVSGGDKEKHVVRTKILLVQNNTYYGQSAPPQPLEYFSSYLGWPRGFLGSAVHLEVMLLLPFLLSSSLQLALSVLAVP